tara:strand:- start:119 stop:400 length:282 start_codon:yes stop_codon:yes gene_type:complete
MVVKYPRGLGQGLVGQVVVVATILEVEWHTLAHQEKDKEMMVATVIIVEPLLIKEAEVEVVQVATFGTGRRVTCHTQPVLHLILVLQNGEKVA